jgi:hypothetical protein
MTGVLSMFASYKMVFTDKVLFKHKISSSLESRLNLFKFFSAQVTFLFE